MNEETEIQDEKNETAGPRPLSAFLFAQNSPQTPTREQSSGPEVLFVAPPQRARAPITPLRRSSPCERIDYPFYDLDSEESEEETVSFEESVPESTEISRSDLCYESPSPATEEKVLPKTESAHSPNRSAGTGVFFSFPLEMTSGAQTPGIYRRYLELVRHKERLQKLQSSPLPSSIPSESAKNVEPSFSKEGSSGSESPLARIEQLQQILTVLPDASKETLLDLLQQLKLASTGL